MAPFGGATEAFSLRRPRQSLMTLSKQNTLKTKVRRIHCLSTHRSRGRKCRWLNWHSIVMTGVLSTTNTLLLLLRTSFNYFYAHYYWCHHRNHH